MTLQDILQKYLTLHNITGREFARNCNGKISYPYIANILRGYSPSTGAPPKVSKEKLEIIAHGMGITLEELRGMMGEETRKPFIPTPRVETFSPEYIRHFFKNTTSYIPSSAMVPIIGSVRCAPGGLAYQELQGSEMADVGNPSEYFWLRAEGDSMAPDIREGDLVLIHIQPQVESGELAVVIVDGEEGVLKKFIRTGNTVILQSFNPAYQPRVFTGEEINLLHIAGRVMETKRKY